MFRQALIIAIILMIAGCRHNWTRLPSTVLPISEQMELKTDRLSLTWSPSGVYALFDNGHLYHLADVGQTEWTEIKLSHDKRCKAIYYDSLRYLDIDILTLEVACFNPESLYLKGFDLRHESTYDLISHPLPLRGHVSFNGLDSPYIFSGFRMFGMVYWVTDDGLTPMPIVLSNGDKVWNLLDTPELERRWENDSARVDKRIYEAGLLSGAELSPRGDTIALTATLEPMGQTTPSIFARFEWAIYLVDPETYESSILLDGLIDGTLWSWSPDGEWLAYGDRGHLWVLNVDTREKRLIFARQIEDMAWSPASDQIVLAECLEPICESKQIVLVDVIELTSDSR